MMTPERMKEIRLAMASAEGYSAYAPEAVARVLRWATDRWGGE